MQMLPPDVRPPVVAGITTSSYVGALNGPAMHSAVQGRAGQQEPVVGGNVSDHHHLFGPTAHSLFSSTSTGGHIPAIQQEPAAEGNMSDPRHLFGPTGRSLFHNTSTGGHIAAPLATEPNKVQMTRHISGSRAMPLNVDGHCPQY
jgi:hypothetical protein